LYITELYSIKIFRGVLRSLPYPIKNPYNYNSSIL